MGAVLIPHISFIEPLKPVGSVSMGELSSSVQVWGYLLS